MFKDKKYSKPESNIKINFNDKLDNYNPFSDANYIKTANFKTPNDISSIYLKTILNIEINNINKKIIYDSRINKNKNDFLYKIDRIYATEEIQRNLLEPIIKPIYNKLKINIKDTVKDSHDSIFIEVEDIYNNYKFIHQFQWNIKSLNTQVFIAKMSKSWFVYLATKIEQI